MYNDSGCKTDVRKVNASQRRKHKFKVTRTDSTDIVQSMLFAMVLVIHRTRHIAPLTSTFDILLLLDGMVWRNGDYTRWLYPPNLSTEIPEVHTTTLLLQRVVFSRNLTKTLTSIYRDVVLKICTNRDNRQINLVYFVVNSDEWENIKRCK